MYTSPLLNYCLFLIFFAVVRNSSDYPYFNEYSAKFTSLFGADCSVGSIAGKRPAVSAYDFNEFSSDDEGNDALSSVSTGTATSSNRNSFKRIRSGPRFGSVSRTVSNDEIHAVASTAGTSISSSDNNSISRRSTVTHVADYGNGTRATGENIGNSSSNHVKVVAVIKKKCTSSSSVTSSRDR